MRDPQRLSRIVGVAGGVSLVVGSFDPLEGSALILPGSALLALGSYLGRDDSRTIAYRTWSFILVALGVAGLFGLSAIGGVGGSSGHSMWWALLILPYMVGWSIDLWGPGSARWISVAGIAIGTWYLAIAGIILWRVRGATSAPLISPAIALGLLGVATIVACGMRLRRSTAFPNAT